MKFTEILPEISSPIAFHAELVPVVGSHEAAVLICQLTYWTGKQHNRDGWIYKTQEEWFFETLLTEKQQQTARELLIQHGFIKERKRGIPARLEYRLVDGALNAVWETWMIAFRIKKQFQTLMGMYGVLLSRGLQNEEIQSQMEKFREGVRRCHVVANQFFKKCQELKVSPLSVIDGLRQKLSRLAESLGKSTFSQSEKLASPDGRNKESHYGETRISPTEKQVPPDGRSAPPSSPATASAPAPSKNTSNTTSDITQVSTHSGAENTHIEGQVLDFFPGEENKEGEQGFVKRVEIEVLHDTQQEREDRGSNSQGQNCIFMKGNIPGAGRGENFEISETPNWVQELEDKVRRGATLPRSELLQLAEYRLGDSAGVYRESGRVLDASPNDIKPDFIKFLQWYAFNRHPDISYVRSSVAKAERNPERWGVLLSWISTFKEVLTNPSVLETMLNAKVSGGGRKANSEDLALQFDLTAQKFMSV